MAVHLSVRAEPSTGKHATSVAAYVIRNATLVVLGDKHVDVGLDVVKDACDRRHETRNCGQSCRGLRTIFAMEDTVRRQECCYAVQIASTQQCEVAPYQSLVSFDVIHGRGHPPAPR